jgi:hypothetical protein
VRYLRGLLCVLAIVVAAGAVPGTASAAPMDVENDVSSCLNETGTDCTVTLAVSGGGKVDGDVSGTGTDFYDCRSPGCSHAVPYQCRVSGEDVFCDPRTVTLRATPAPGWGFAGFSGDCVSSSATCVMSVPEARNVSAEFRDVTAPNVSLIAPAPDSVIRTNSVITATASDGESGVSYGYVFFIPAGTNSQLGTAQGIYISGPGTHTGNWTGRVWNGSGYVVVADGAYDLQAWARDHGGNSTYGSRRPVIVDNTPPAGSITAPAPGAAARGGSEVLLRATFTDATTSVVNVDFAVSRTGANQWSPVPTSSLGGGTYGGTWTAPAADGSYDVRATATDRAGNAKVETVTFTVDATPPDITFIGGPSVGSITRARSATFTWVTDGSSVNCRLYPSGGTVPAFSPCSGPSSHSAADLADGAYLFDVRAADAVGNVTEKRISWTIDGTPPETRITSPPPASTTDTNVTIPFDSTEAGATFACALDGAAFAPCSSPASLSSLAPGAHTFRVQATDAAGNVDPTPAEASWTVVVVAPPPPPPPPVVQCKVPSVKGRTLAQAKTALTKANCALGKVTRAFSTRAKKGKVLKQSPAAGRILAKGAKVAVTVGKGPRR